MTRILIYLFVFLATYFMSACSDPIERPPLVLTANKEYWALAGSSATIIATIDGLEDEDAAWKWQIADGLTAEDTTSPTLTVTVPTVNECEVRTFAVSVQVKTPSERYEGATSFIHVADKSCTIDANRLGNSAQYSLVTVNEFDNLGEVWAGTQDKGLFRIYDSNKVDGYNASDLNIKEDRIVTIKPEGKGAWLATNTYLHRAHLTGNKIFAKTEKGVDKVDEWSFEPDPKDAKRYFNDLYVSENDSILYALDGAGNLHKAKLNETDKDVLSGALQDQFTTVTTTNKLPKSAILADSKRIILHDNHFYLFSDKTMNIYDKDFGTEVHSANLPAFGDIQNVLSFGNHIYICGDSAFVRVTSLPSTSTPTNIKLYEDEIHKTPTDLRNVTSELKSTPTFRHIAASNEYVFLATDQGVFVFSSDDNDIELEDSKRFYNSDNADFKIFDNDIVSIAYEHQLSRLWVLSRTKGLMGIIIPLVLSAQ